MFGHMALGSNDLDRSAQFYDAVFAAWGGPAADRTNPVRLVYNHRGAMLIITTPLDGDSASHGNGSTMGFRMDNPAEIDAWHEAGLSAGGVSVEDPPGWRPRPYGRIYLAYLRDPDGNKLCAAYREETK